MADDETVTVEIIDKGRPGAPTRHIPQVSKHISLHGFVEDIMYAAAMIERWQWGARQHDAFLSLPPRELNWNARLSTFVDPGTNTVRFILETPPPITAHDAVSGLTSMASPSMCEADGKFVPLCTSGCIYSAVVKNIHFYSC
jgi:hypothetical protein